MSVVNRSKAKEIIREWQDNQKVIVFTNGCFDIIHRGHVEYLEQAKLLGDILIVGLNSDDSVKRIKGKSRPIQDEHDRAAILNALRMVDIVVVFEEDTPLELICELKPNILVKGGDYNLDSIIGSKEVETWEGSVKIIPFLKGYGTSQLVDKILDG